MWLKKGDANTEIFHTMLNNCRNSNIIPWIWKDGTTVEGDSRIDIAFTNFFATYSIVNKIFASKPTGLGYLNTRLSLTLLW